MPNFRPEHQAPPDLFYNEDESRKYTNNTRINEIQTEMTERAIDLLALPDDRPSFILDLGCGSGICGQILEENGHIWHGIDISTAMLDIAKDNDEMEGDLSLGDLGNGIPFRAGTFDGCISISALQWLCHSYSKNQHPQKRLYKLFSELYGALSRGSRAVFQFYPENDDQIDLINQQAMKAGFSGGVLVDFPNSTKAKKFYLVLMTGGEMELPAALQEEYASQRNTGKSFKELKGKNVKSRCDWIKEKKERRKKKGKNVPKDSKYTGRRRR